MTSTLGPDDPRRGGAPIHYYSIWPAERLMVRIRMTSLAVDPFLYLFDASGRLMAQAFEPGADVTLPDAVLEATLDPGCYLVGASTWEPATGTYTLLVSAAD